jgi:hypothetical protein
VATDAVIVDADTRTAQATAVVLPGADLQTYHALEQRAAASAPTWKIAIVPPLQPLPAVRFANGSDTIDDNARQAIMTAAWAARRWNSADLAVPGLPQAAKAQPKHPLLAQRRATAISQILAQEGVQSVPAAAAGLTVRLALATTKAAP